MTQARAGLSSGARPAVLRLGDDDDKGDRRPVPPDVFAATQRRLRRALGITERTPVEDVQPEMGVAPGMCPSHPYEPLRERHVRARNGLRYLARECLACERGRKQRRRRGYYREGRG